MLDLDHPMTEHIFSASALIDGLMMRAQEMSVSPSEKRRDLWQECRHSLNTLGLLNRAQFENSEFISDAIAAAETALQTLAEAGGGQITQDHSDGKGHCAVCQTPITVHDLRIDSISYSRFIILCSPCVEPFMRAKGKLDSPKGFGTCFI